MTTHLRGVIVSFDLDSLAGLGNNRKPDGYTNKKAPQWMSVSLYYICSEGTNVPWSHIGIERPTKVLDCLLVCIWLQYNKVKSAFWLLNSSDPLNADCWHQQVVKEDDGKCRELFKTVKWNFKLWILPNLREYVIYRIHIRLSHTEL